MGPSLGDRSLVDWHCSGKKAALNFVCERPATAAASTTAAGAFLGNVNLRVDDGCKSLSPPGSWHILYSDKTTCPPGSRFVQTAKKEGSMCCQAIRKTPGTSFVKPVGSNYGCMAIGPKGFIRTQCHDRKPFMCDLSESVKEWRWVSGVAVPKDFRWSQQSDGLPGEQCIAYTNLGDYVGQRCRRDNAFLCEDKCPINNPKVGSQCLFISTEKADWQAARLHCEDMAGELMQPKERQWILDFYSTLDDGACTLSIGSKCLTLSEENDKLSWNDAAKACEENGGHLAVLPDPEDVLNYLNGKYKSIVFWAGGSDSVEEGKWVWVNGEPFNNKFPWKKPQPDNAGGDQDCLVVNWKNQYDDQRCTTKMRYICESDFNYWMGASYKDTWSWSSGTPLLEPYLTDMGSASSEYCMSLGDDGFKSLLCSTKQLYMCDLSKAYNRAIVEVDFKTVGGEAKATSIWDQNWVPINAFTERHGGWHNKQGSKLPQSLWYEFPIPQIIKRFSFKTRPITQEGYSKYGPTIYKFWASNGNDCSDKNTWDILLEDHSDIPFTKANIPKEEDVNNVKSYKCYGFEVLKSRTETYCAISNVRMYLAPIGRPCVIGGILYPSGKIFNENCMKFNCYDGRLFSDLQYNSDCGICNIQNDPHITNFDGVKFDWHGHNTYYMASEGCSKCPSTYISAKFTDCARGLPWATCVDTTHVQIENSPKVTVYKAKAVTDTIVSVLGHNQTIAVTKSRELQILEGPDGAKAPFIAWHAHKCLHIMSINNGGLMLKYCGWSMKIFAYPYLHGNLCGMCGTWSGDKVLHFRNKTELQPPPKKGSWDKKRVDKRFGRHWLIEDNSDNCEEDNDLGSGEYGELCNCHSQEKCPILVACKNGQVCCNIDNDGRKQCECLSAEITCKSNINCDPGLEYCCLPDNPCNPTEKERTIIYNRCMKMYGTTSKKLTESQKNILIENCALDQCLALKAPNGEEVAKVFMGKSRNTIQEEEEEADATVVFEPPVCPRPYILAGPYCYFISLVPQVGLPWQDALKRCHDMGGMLAEPKDSQHFINFLIGVLPEDVDESLWLGGSNKKDMVWQWVSGDRVESSMIEDTNSGNCMRITISSREFTITDAKCDSIYNYICIYKGRHICPSGCHNGGICISQFKCQCEKGWGGPSCEKDITDKCSTLLSTNCKEETICGSDGEEYEDSCIFEEAHCRNPELKRVPCDQGSEICSGVLVGSQCLLFISAPLNWHEAERDCKGRGGKLAVVTEYHRLLAHIREFGDTEYWIGASKSIDGGGGLCPHISFGSSCLTFSEDSLSWQEASAACKANGGQLAVLQEPNEVLNYVIEKYEAVPFWAGGSDIGKEGSWMWVNDKPFNDQFPWHSKQPDNMRGEDCLMVNWKKGYNDKSCETTMRYICESGPCDLVCTKEYKPVCDSNGRTHSNLCMMNIYYCKDPTVPTYTMGACGKGCPDIRLGLKCLTFSKDSLKWNDAEVACKANGGQLAVLTEPTNILNYAKKTYESVTFWAGGSDSKEEGSWVWVNDEPFNDKFPWHISQINNRGQDCLAVNWNKGYDDQDCDQEMRYICESGPCDLMCTKEYKPVCDSNGRTHSNLCMMNLYYCKDNTVPTYTMGACEPPSAYTCEGTNLEIKCEVGHVIKVIHASYGRSNMNICPQPDVPQWSVNCHSESSRQVLDVRCNGKKNCNVAASNGIFGDPCPGTYKYLKVDYVCVPDETWSGIINACLKGNDYKIHDGIPTFEACKAKCVEEKGKVCRSVEYHPIENKCLLSGLRSDYVHFEEPCTKDGWIYAERIFEVGSWIWITGAEVDMPWTPNDEDEEMDCIMISVAVGRTGLANEICSLDKGYICEIGPCDYMCTREYRPICDANGITHSNLCMLNKYYCNYRTVPTYTNGVCDCNKNCRKHKQPVCDNKGNEYINECFFDIAWCKDNSLRPAECKVPCPVYVRCDCETGFEINRYMHAITGCTICECVPCPVYDCRCENEERMTSIIGPNGCPRCFCEPCPLPDCRCDVGFQVELFINSETNCPNCRCICEDETEYCDKWIENMDPIDSDFYSVLQSNPLLTPGTDLKSFFKPLFCKGEKGSPCPKMCGKCPEDCRKYCTRILKPVCANNGKTYQNLCELENAMCDDSSLAKIDCVCNKPCTEEYMPVCGSDGKMYSNKCKFYNAWCQDNSLYIVKCSIDYCPQIDCHCDLGFSPIIYTDLKTGCPNCRCGCRKVCTDEEFDPVCGSDGLTYDNRCQFEIAKCKHGDLTIVLCRELIDPCHALLCGCAPGYKTIFSEDELGCVLCRCEQCPQMACDCVIGLPEIVLDDYGCPMDCTCKTCPMMACLCLEGYTQEQIINEQTGCEECTCVCKDTEQCADNGPHILCQDEKVARMCPEKCGVCSDCTRVCTTDYRPVCGNDGITYSNRCEFDNAVCRNYDLSEILCNCVKMCEKKYSPVCGSDGKTYGNKCMFHNAWCGDNSLEMVRCKTDICVLMSCMCTYGYDPVTYVDEVDGCSKCRCVQCPVFRCGCPPEQKIIYTTNELGCKSCECEPCIQPMCDCKQGRVAVITQGYDGCPKCKCELCPPFDCKCKTGQDRFTVQELSTGCPVCQCRCTKECPKEYNNNPVCGSDGRVYSNRCVFENAQCEKDLTEVMCDCMRPCPEYYSPVCGSDGLTYDNDCFLKKAWCQDHTLYAVPCSRDDPCAVMMCRCPFDYTLVTYTVEGCQRCRCDRCVKKPCDCPPKTTMITVPDPNTRCPGCVCRPCPEFKCECQEGQQVREIINRITGCPSCSCVCKDDRSCVKIYHGLEKFWCQFPDVREKCPNLCKACSQQNVDNCKTPADAICVDVTICGSDGVTYSNTCPYKEAICRNPKLTEVECTGGMDKCKTLQPPGTWVSVYRDSPGCPLGTQPVETGFIAGGMCCQPIPFNPDCLQSCGTIFSPVCGSDGVKYSNKCMFDNAKCKNSILIEVICLDNGCEDASYCQQINMYAKEFCKQSVIKRDCPLMCGDCTSGPIGPDCKDYEACSSLVQIDCSQPAIVYLCPSSCGKCNIQGLDDCTSLSPPGSWQAVYLNSPGCPLGTNPVESVTRAGSICCQPIDNSPGICSNGCHNGGTCIGPDHCVCTFGWTGAFCQVTSVHIDIDVIIENLIGDIGSLTEITWRTDLRCGPNFTMDGRPSTCNPISDHPCCSPCGWCGNTKLHCLCRECNDYRKNSEDYSIAIAIRALMGICRKGDSCDTTIETLNNLVEQQRQNIRDLQLNAIRKSQLLQNLQIQNQITIENIEKLMRLKSVCPLPFAHLEEPDECVLLSRSAMTWKEAVEDCKSQDAYLYIPDDYNKAATYMLTNRISTDSDGLFVGAANAKNKPFTWVDGSSTSSKDFIKAPNSNNALCAVFVPQFQKLDVVECTEERHFICEKDKYKKIKT